MLVFLHIYFSFFFLSVPSSLWYRKIGLHPSAFEYEMSGHLCPYMGQINETGAYFSQPPSPHFNVGGVVWEKLGGTFGFRFRNNIEMGGQGSEGDFHNDALVGVKYCL